MDYYKVLGVEKNASDNTIKDAYKKLAKEHHPDLGGDENKFKQLNEAYETLKNSKTRREYDFNGNNHFGNFRYSANTVNIDDIINEMEKRFRAGDSGGFKPRQRTTNHNLNITVNMELKDFVLNEGESTIEKHLSVRMSNGDRELVKINIPPHIQSGETIRYQGLGDNVNKSLTRGDLFVTIVLNNHPIYEKKGLDLYTTIIIDSFEAILGCDPIIKTLSGKNLKVKIPAGTNYGAVMNIRNEGLRYQNQHGNILIQIIVNTSKDLTQTQVDFIRKAKLEK